MCYMCFEIIVISVSFVLRNAIDMLRPSFIFEDDFRKFIVVSLRKFYQDWFRNKPQSYSKSTGGTELDAVKEVSLLHYTLPLLTF